MTATGFASMVSKISQEKTLDWVAQQKNDTAIQYIRAKVDQLLTLMGTLPLRPEELDDNTLIELDPIGIVAGAFEQVLTHLKQTNHELTIARNEIRSVFDAFGAAVIVVDKKNCVVDCNRQAIDWFFHLDDKEQIIGRALDQVCKCPERFPKAYEVEHKSTSEFSHAIRYYQLINTAIYDESSQIEKVVHLCFDITTPKQAEEILSAQAETDELTGIANRRQFDRACKSEMHRAERYQLPLALILLDIDHFKSINDTLGHQLGDRVLVELTNLISGMIRGQDLFARWGGEEFVILAPSREMGGAMQFAEKLRTAIESHSFPGVQHLTCSFGLTEYRSREQIETFFGRVDSALYRAKGNGRNRVERT